jgi:hypothetical protein
LQIKHLVFPLITLGRMQQVSLQHHELLSSTSKLVGVVSD